MKTPIPKILAPLSAALAFLFFISCLQNKSTSSIDQSAETANDNRPLNAKPLYQFIDSSQDLSLAQLFDKVANTPADENTFPCDFAIVGKPQKIRDLKKQWVSKVDDSRYRVDGCVCPGICLIELTDRQKSSPDNSELLIIDGNYGVGGQAPATVRWLSTNLDLTNAYVGWVSGIAQVVFKDSNSDIVKTCFVDRKEKRANYITSCGDVHGNKLPPL